MDYLKEKGFECVDFGPYTSEEKVNYPDYGLKVAEAVASGECDKGVLVCGTGVGISLAANKVQELEQLYVANLIQQSFQRSIIIQTFNHRC